MSQEKKQQMIVPGETGWERWTLAAGSAEGGWVREELPEREELEPWSAWELAPAKEDWIYVAPSLGFSDIAVRLPPVESGGVDELMPLRLEAAGISAPELPGVVASDWEEVRSRQSGRVVFAWTWSEDPLGGFEGGRAPEMLLPRWRTLPLPASRVVFWRELGVWHGAVTGPGGCLNVQALGEAGDSGVVAGALRAQITSLMLRGLGETPDSAVVYGTKEDVPEGVTGACSLLGLAHTVVEMPAPVLPKVPSRLVASAMSQMRENRASARRWKLRIAAAAALWLLLAAWVAFGYVSDARALELATQAREEIEPQARVLREIQDAWDAVAEVNGIDAFPLELLLRMEQVRPPGNMRLTNFNVAPDKSIFLRGSSPTADLALSFAENVRRSPNLANYAWETPYPQSQADGSFSFTISGKPRTLATR